jgi:hypothetical protein
MFGPVDWFVRYLKYDWREAAGGSHSRLTKITYPNGFELWYTYAAGLDSNVSRVTSFSDTPWWNVVEELVYQGEQIVGRNHYNNVNSLITFDDFGRVAEVDWQYSWESLSRYAYGYDKAGNRLYREDKVNSEFSELYEYDSLNQLTSFKRGELNSAKDAIASPTSSQSWNLAELGNWDSVTTDSSTETRVSNAQNEYTTVVAQLIGLLARLSTV